MRSTITYSELRVSAYEWWVSIWWLAA
jgi:hypothetical protein